MSPPAPRGVRSPREQASLRDKQSRLPYLKYTNMYVNCQQELFDLFLFYYLYPISLRIIWLFSTILSTPPSFSPSTKNIHQRMFVIFFTITPPSDKKQKKEKSFRFSLKCSSFTMNQLIIRSAIFSQRCGCVSKINEAVTILVYL